MSSAFRSLSAVLAVAAWAAVLSLCCGTASAQTAAIFVEANAPGFLAMDSAGFLYATAPYDNNILKLNSALQVVQLINTTSAAAYLQEPLGIAVVGTTIYTVDARSNHLVAFSTSTGALLGVYDLAAQGIEFPIGLAASPSGTSLYVVDTGANPVHQVSLNGTLLHTFNTSTYLNNEFDNALAVGVDASGNVYVACYELTPDYYLGTAELFELSPAGSLVRILNITTYTGIGIPEGVAIAPNGAIFVVDDANDALIKLAANGTVLFNVSTLTNGYYTVPSDAVIDPTSSFVYVADVYTARVDKYDFNTGALLTSVATSSTAITRPQAVAVLGSNVYVTGGAMGFVSIVAQNATQVGSIYLGTVPNHDPVAIAIDASGFTYVADGAYSVVYKISAAGVLVQGFNTTNPALSLRTSYNLAVAANGDLYVSDQGNARIVHFAASGAVLLAFNATQAGSAFSPAGLGLLPNGQLAAADPGTLRVYVFSTAGTVVTSWNYTAAWSPRGLVVGTSTAGVTQIFVSDSVGLQVVVFSTTGAVLRTFTSTSPPISSPAGLALSSGGDLYLADQSESRIFVVRNAVNAAASSVKGDPQFVGLRGQSFQVHGLDGAVYALVSSPSTQVNARFAFLSSGRCPPPIIIATQCWSHPGSYLGAVSVQERMDGEAELQRLTVEAGAHDVGFASAELNGRLLAVGDSASIGHFSVQRPSSHRLEVRTRELHLVLENSDGFINQQAAALVPLQCMTAHGLLGQTHSAQPRQPGALRHIDGDVDDYVVSDLFAHDFAYDQFSD